MRTFSIRLTKEEFAEILLEAHKNEMTMSDYIKNKVFIGDKTTKLTVGIIVRQINEKIHNDNSFSIPQLFSVKEWSGFDKESINDSIKIFMQEMKKARHERYDLLRNIEYIGKGDNKVDLYKIVYPIKIISN